MTSIIQQVSVHGHGCVQAVFVQLLQSLDAVNTLQTQPVLAHAGPCALHGQA